jgi:hypothetical protein
VATRYYVHTELDENGDNEVHKASCFKLPSEKNRTDLGEFDSCVDAVKEAKKTYPTTANGCVHCSKECHTG